MEILTNNDNAKEEEEEEEPSLSKKEKNETIENNLKMRQNLQVNQVEKKNQKL